MAIFRSSAAMGWLCASNTCHAASTLRNADPKPLGGLAHAACELRVFGGDPDFVPVFAKD
jgi:hypothetical protein